MPELKLYDPDLFHVYESSWHQRWWPFILGIICGLIIYNLCDRVQGEVYDCKPVRNVQILPSTYLMDLESHCSRPDIYRDADLVTWAHEMTHGVNADLRNSTPPGDAFFYVYKDKAFKVMVPRTVNMLQVRIKLPYIGTAFQTYFSQNVIRDWNDDVTFFFDEWCAYINGCMCGLDKNLIDRTIESFDHANQLGLYSIIATKNLNQKDINEYIDYNIKRTELIKSALPRYNQQYYDTLMQYYKGKPETNNLLIIESK